VPEGYFRTWVDATSMTIILKTPWSFARRRQGRFPVVKEDGESILRSKMCNHCAILHARKSVRGCHLHQPRWRCIDRPEICLGCAYCVQAPLWLRYVHPTKEWPTVHALLHRITKGLRPPAARPAPPRAPTGGFEDPNDPSTSSQDAQRAGVKRRWHRAKASTTTWMARCGRTKS